MQNANVNKLGFWVEADKDGSQSEVFYVATLQEAIDLEKQFEEQGAEDWGMGLTEFATDAQRAEHKKYVMQKAADILSTAI